MTLDPLRLEAFVDETRAVARRRLVPLAGVGTEGGVNRPLVRELGATGLLSRLFADDRSALELCLLREALARESTQAETAFALQGLGAVPVLLAGSTESRERWIPRVASGEAVAAFALTEPEAGSDAGALALEARTEDGGFRLFGTKKFISNAPEADVYTVFARTKQGVGSKGITAFAVPGDAEGLSGKSLALISPHPIGTLDFAGVFVAEDAMLGELDEGFGIAMRTLDLFRPSVGAFAVGMAQAALDSAVAHADEREAFGKKLRELQAVSHLLAEMATRTEAARLLVRSAASAYDGQDAQTTQKSAMAKLFATEAAQFVVDAAIQVHGAAALEKGHLLEHLYRDVRATRIYEGASEVQREIISRALYR